MVNKKARKSVALDEATTRAIEQLGALSFRPSDGLAPPSNWMREVTKEEMAAAIEALESDSDEDGGTDEESPNGNKKKGTAGAHDDPSHGQNWIELDDGSGEIHISIYLGDEWVAAIMALDAIQPIHIPGMQFTPHPWQAKGAAQGHWLCEQPDFKIFYCGDEMGLGKTVLAIMMIKLAQPQPGFCLVVAPKTVGVQWEDECNRTFKREEALRIVRLTDSKTTAHQLYAQRPEVVIVSYEFVEHIYRSMKAFLIGKTKERPTSCLHTGFWEFQGYPIKRLILDEAHRIGNTKSARYRSLFAISAEATVMLSGTFPHNRWTGWAGPMSFAKHQPITSLSSFNHTFGSWDYDGKLEPEPMLSRLKLLQRWLMRFTVARPADVLNLPGVEHYKSSFELDPDHSALSEGHYLQYIQARKMEKEKYEDNLKKKKNRKADSSQIKALDSVKKGDSMSVLIHAIRAQQASMHPILLDRRFRAKRKPVPDKKNKELNSDEELESDEALGASGDEYQPPKNRRAEEKGLAENDGARRDKNNSTSSHAAIVQADMDAVHTRQANDNSEAETSSRKLWLQHLEANRQLVFESARVRHVVELYAQLRQEHPTRKIVISSQYLRFLDMVKTAVQLKFGIEGFDYNGVIADALRQKNLETFRSWDTSASKPLYLSGKAGGEGLNIPEASILIQTEVWWNRNAELQLYSRLLRPGQKDIVIVIRVEAISCSIDECIINVQSKKKTVNTVLMRPLVRPHDQPPQIPEMRFREPYLAPKYDDESED